MPIKIDKQTALVVVDIQNDFCPGGALPVANGDDVVTVLNRYIEYFRRAGAPILFTRDWHPPDHSSFKSQGGPWPPHCIQNTEGAKFHRSLVIPPEGEIISKAERHDEAYSFFQGTDLGKKLRARGIRKLMVGGLATDYCVRATVLDGLENGFEVFHLDDASRGVNVKPHDSEEAFREMVAKGAKRMKFEDLATQSEVTISSRRN